jgi:hypothetical protein
LEKQNLSLAGDLHEFKKPLFFGSQTPAFFRFVSNVFQNAEYRLIFRGFAVCEQRHNFIHNGIEISRPGAGRKPL